VQGYSVQCAAEDKPFALKEKIMSTNTMKAMRLHEFSSPEVLRYEEVPKPS
jgi:hypothetical protein